METQEWMNKGLNVIRTPEFRDGMKRFAKRIPPEALELLGLSRGNGVALVAGAASLFVAGIAAGASLALLMGPDAAKNRAMAEQAVARLKAQLMEAFSGVEHGIPTADASSIHA